MKIKKITLTKECLQVTLNEVKPITAVYLDKASNYGNIYSTKPSEHSFKVNYTASDNVLKISIPGNAPTFFTITIFSNDEVTSGMYLNEFSLFKAKSKYLLAFEGCCGCNDRHGCNSICVGCNEKKKRYGMIAYMLRLNLFRQCYINKNQQLAVKYYIDACRIYDMDCIYFEYKDFLGDGYQVSTNMYSVFDELNNWIKGNTCACEAKVLESLLISDLYSLIFGNFDVSDDDGGGDEPQPTEKSSMYYGYLHSTDIAQWRDMFWQGTNDLSLLTVADIQKGMDKKTLVKAQLASKQVVVDTPDDVGAILVLIPTTSSKIAQKWNGVNDWMRFVMSGEEDKIGVVSNGENTITIDGVTYKIYGEDYIIPGETTLKIS